MTTQPQVVELHRWTPARVERIGEARAQLASVLPADATIDHIGSTSMPGLLAADHRHLGHHEQGRSALGRSADLEALGYAYNPKYFSDDPDHLFLKRDTDGRRTEHLHIFHPRSPVPQADRAFRDFLRTHTAEARRYSDAKWAAAQAHPNSRAAYHRAKEPILQELLGSARGLGWAHKPTRHWSDAGVPCRSGVVLNTTRHERSIGRERIDNQLTESTLEPGDEARQTLC